MVFGNTRLYWSNKRNHEVTTKTSERKVIGYKNSEVSGRVYSKTGIIKTAVRTKTAQTDFSLHPLIKKQFSNIHF